MEVSKMADTNEKVVVDHHMAISTGHTSINTIEVYSGGALAIGDHAKIIQHGVDIQHKVWWKVPGLQSTFVGRTRELEDLHEKIVRAQGSASVITGLGGIGKSSLAKKYAHLKGISYFNGNVVWISAEDMTSLTNSFVGLSQYLGVNEKDMVMDARVERVYDNFQNTKSLFIFDNAEGMSTIKPFLPVANPAKGTPNVIITSQVIDWPDYVELLKLDNLDRNEAVSLIIENLNTTNSILADEKEASLLAEELQCFPLALQQALAYIKKYRRRRKFTIKDYIKALKCKTREVLDTLPPCHDYTKTVYVTWNVTFDRLKDLHNRKLVMNVLATMAFMHADDIPWSTFTDYADEDDIWEALETLEQYCLIKQVNRNEIQNDQDEALFGIHRLVQKVVQLTLDPDDVTCHLERTLTTIQKFVRGGYGNYTRDKQFMYHAMQVWNHAKAFESFQKEYCYLPIKITDALLYQGRYAESLAYATDEYEFLAKKLGDKHHSTLAMIFNKARSYHCLGKLKDAVALYEEAIDKQRRILGEMHCDTLASEIDLAFCYIDLELPKISLEIFKEVYEKKKCCEQADYSGKQNTIELYRYRDIYTAMYGIGHALQLLKRYDEAEEHYALFYEQRRQTDGECHPRRLHAGNKLAEVKIEKGEYTGAYELLQDVYKKQVNRLGDRHPHSMTTLKTIVKCLKLKGEIEEARLTLYDLHEKILTELGPEHLDTKKIEKMLKDFDKADKNK